ncbi:zincin [Hesseltinella vesiculosa]|uniref:Zincin n=1 Tax=Hesseltinella vesiculosa TaxID=101127 RepID=A0A1X2GAK2_9FUNG|nr:zincin [Hesseltinella vesiculosa]
MGLFVLLAVFIGLYAHRVYSGHQPPEDIHPPNGDPATPVCTTPGCVLTAAQILQDIDTTVDPCEDFYAFTCNNWARHHNIPDGKPETSSFQALYIANKEVIRSLLTQDRGSFDQQLEKTLPDPEKLVDKQNFYKVKDLYDSCMNETVIDQRGAEPLLPLIKDLYKAFPAENDLSPHSLTKTLALLMKQGVSPLFQVYVEADPVNPDISMIYTSQSGLTLPNKHYYDDKKYLDALRTAVTKTLAIVLPVKKEAVDSVAQQVVDVEEQLALISDELEDLSDPIKSNNPTSISNLTKLAPKVDWDLLLTDLVPATAPHQDMVIVSSPAFVEKLNKLLGKTSNEALQSYFIWQLVSAYTSVLGEEVRKPAEELNSFVQGTSVKSMPPRWDTCLSHVDDSVGFLAGRLFVQETFSGNIKERADDFVASIKEAFLERLPQLDWLDDATRDKAYEKVDKFVQKVGYPTQSPDVTSPISLSEYYSGLHIDRDDFFNNYVQTVKFQVKQQWDKVGKKTDKQVWLMNPQEVNAYYNPPYNEIVFPAGILQNPFFGKDYPDYLNYGGIGTVVGHELTHGFDNGGRHFDSNGRLEDWWSNATSNAFDERAECFVKQYDQFTVDAGNGEKVHVKGKQTLGENIADNGGIGESFSAWKKRYDSDPLSEKYNNQHLPGLDNFTPEQLFFINFGRIWCGKTTPERAKQRVLIDVHSPGKYRTIGSVQNSKHFAEVFQCPVGSPMNPAKKCELW